MRDESKNIVLQSHHNFRELQLVYRSSILHPMEPTCSRDAIPFMNVTFFEFETLLHLQEHIPYASNNLPAQHKHVPVLAFHTHWFCRESRDFYPAMNKSTLCSQSYVACGYFNAIEYVQRCIKIGFCYIM